MLFEKAQTKVSTLFVIVDGKHPSVVGRSNPPFSVKLQLNKYQCKVFNSACYENEKEKEIA